MPIKKLIELDGEYGGWLEIDPIKLKRVATIFREWLMVVDPGNDPFGFLKKDLPIVDQALKGELSLPYKKEPHARDLGERILPEEYMKNSSPFYNVIRGALDDPPQVINKDGRYFAWTEWEDPPAT